MTKATFYGGVSLLAMAIAVNEISVYIGAIALSLFVCHLAK